MSDQLSFHLNLSLEEIVDFIANGSHECILLLDAKGKFISFPDTFCHPLGYTFQQMRTKSLKSVLGIKVPVDQMYVSYNLSQDVRAALPMVNIQLHNGQKLNSPYSIARFSSEKPERNYYLLRFHDFYRNQHMNLLQQFADTFMKDINLGVILIDNDFILVDISDMACRVLGLEKQKIISKPMEEVFASVPIEHQLVQRTILDGMVVRNYAISWMNNQDRYELLLDSNLLKDNQGRTAGAYLIFKDVTNLRSLEEQVQRSDRLAMIGQIAAGTAHEIRNPLTSIKGFMQVLKNTFIQNGMIKEQGYTEIMLIEIDRINDLVSEFLLLSKRKNVTFGQVDLTAVLGDIVPIINNEAILHNVTVHYEPAPELPKVIADSELLKQVFLNLCKNGIEAMVENGILLITEKVDYEERKVLVDIHDTGPGIPSFVIDKIFDPFFTTKENGTGLGLSICQRIVHDMGGSIRVASKGFGTTFTVSLPFP